MLEMPYQALLVVSFGGPESRDEVMPFLENVLRGKSVPRERMLEVAEHYYQFDGISPINGQNRRLIAALEAELQEHGPDLPIYWGNRNWHPMLADTIQQMVNDGVQKALAFVTSAYSSYSGCRQYRENIADACHKVGEAAPQIDKLRVFYNHPAFVEPNAELLRDAIESISPEQRIETTTLFTAHSIPTAMSDGCRYEAQLLEASRLIAQLAGVDNWQLVYQSRSGPPAQPWLEPDVGDALRDLHAKGSQDVVLAPIGFISDHMEVLFDLDTEAKEICDELGMQMTRVSSVGTHPKFVTMIRQLLQERLNDTSSRLCLGHHGPGHDFCPDDCCPSGMPARRAKGTRKTKS